MYRGTYTYPVFSFKHEIKPFRTGLRLYLIQENLPDLRLSHTQHRISESFSATAQEMEFFF